MDPRCVPCFSTRPIFTTHHWPTFIGASANHSRRLWIRVGGRTNSRLKTVLPKATLFCPVGGLQLRTNKLGASGKPRECSRTGQRVSPNTPGNPAEVNREKYGVREWRKLSVRRFLFFFLFSGLRPGTNGVGTGFITTGSLSSGGGVFPCAGPTERSR